MGERLKHNESENWIQKIIWEMQVNKQQNIEIRPTKIKEGIREMENWKTPGPDGIYGYWIKKLVPMQERIAFHLQS